MMRIRVGAATPALFFSFSFAFLASGCIPSPDTSGLPGYDAGASSEDAPFIALDANADGTVIAEAGGDTGVADSALPVGTITGVVIDYTQGNGVGVVANAVVTVSVPSNPSATVPAPFVADANGVFTLTGVPAGTVQISASKPTDLARRIAYSTTNIIAQVSAGQTLSVFPVLHEGCFQTQPLSGADAGADGGGATGITLQTACPTPRTGAYGALAFDQTSFTNPVTGTLYQGAGVRVEMIPLAYPSNGSAVDLSWALALPGLTTPLDLIGAAEYRVIADDPGKADDGVALTVRAGGVVSVAVPVYQGGSSLVAYSYNATTGLWGQETTAALGAVTTINAGSANVQYVNVQIPHLSWWAVTSPATPATCVTGSLRAGGAGLANVWVHAAGVNFLGSSTAVTDSTGTFCLAVQATESDGGLAQLGIAAGYASGGTLYAPPSNPVSVSAGTSGSCATQTGCTALGAITLNPASTCAAGSVTAGNGGAPPGKMNVILENPPVVASQVAAGIKPTAYLGQITLGAGGAFCAPSPPGAILQLTDPGGSGNTAPPSSTFSVPSGSAGQACGGGGCSDAGPLQYGKGT